MPLSELPAGHDLTHLLWALRHVDRFDVAIDGGAHQGIWARHLLRCFKRVIAFEPVESNRAHISIEAEVYPHALGDKRGKVGMVPGPENTGQYHVIGVGHTEMRTLDSFGFTACDFLKLDVEGMELHALKGAEALLKACRPVVMIEENGLCERYGVERMAAHDWLLRLGYVCLGNMNKDYLYKWS